jgi:NAD(P)H-nitrite reductase large subunit
LYIPCIFLNWLIAYSEERSMDELDAWRALCYGEMGLQAVLAVLWGGLTVCSCIAVHKWRHAAKGEIVEGVNKGTVELRDLEAENHSANADGDREGESMRKERMFV